MKDLLKLFADVYSSLPIAIFFYLLNDSVIYQKYGDNFLLALLIIVADGTSLLIKQIPYDDQYKIYFDRPKNACNTDILSSNGLQPSGSHGFPSGHMTTITVFALSMLIRKYIKTPNSTISSFIVKNKGIVGFYMMLIIFMGWSRYYKKVHNVVQILGGVGLGTVFSSIYYVLIK